MKKTNQLFAAVSMAVLLFTGCASTGGSKGESSGGLEPIEIDYVAIQDVDENGNVKGNITWTTLPQVELMCLMCRIAGIQNFNAYYNGDNSYLEQMDTLLGKYKEHQIFKTMRNFEQRGADGSSFISLAYHIKPDFSGTTVPLNPKPDTLHPGFKKIGGVEINNFVKSFHDFAVESNFARLYTLHKGDYLYAAGDYKAYCDKYKLDSWMSDFFTAGEGYKTTINVSKANVAYACYDFAMIDESERGRYLSTFVGNNLYSTAHLYSMCVSQDYATANWDVVKEPFTEFFRSALVTMAPDHKKELEKFEVTDYHLVGVLSEIFSSIYLANVAWEVDETPGLMDEYVNSAIKVYGEEAGEGIFNLMAEYINNRDVYKDIIDLYPRLNEFVINLKPIGN